MCSPPPVVSGGGEEKRGGGGRQRKAHSPGEVGLGQVPRGRQEGAGRALPHCSPLGGSGGTAESSGHPALREPRGALRSRVEAGVELRRVAVGRRKTPLGVGGHRAGPQQTFGGVGLKSASKQRRRFFGVGLHLGTEPLRTVSSELGLKSAAERYWTFLGAGLKSATKPHRRFPGVEQKRNTVGAPLEFG